MYIGLNGDCNVDDDTYCEDFCGQSGCGCLNNQTLIQTSCVCKLTCVY